MSFNSTPFNILPGININTKLCSNSITLGSMDTSIQPSPQLSNTKVKLPSHNIPPKVSMRDHPPQDREHIFKSKLLDIDLASNLPLAEFCLQKSVAYPHKDCLIDGASGKKMSYAEVRSCAIRIARGLAKFGIEKDDVVMIMLPNCIEVALLVLGIAMRGATFTTAHPAAHDVEALRQARASKAKIIITESFNAYKLVTGSSIPIFTTDEPPVGCQHFSILMDMDGENWPNIKIQVDDTVAILYSSGTCGLPKGVMLSHKNITSSICQVVEGDNPNLNISTKDLILCMLPMHHCYCLVTLLLTALRAGAAVVIMKKYNFVDVLSYIEKYKVTVTMLVPPVLLEMSRNPLVMDYDLSSLKMVMCGAAPLGGDSEDAIRLRFPHVVFAQAYGMTEAGPVISMSLAFSKHPFVVKSGSCGTVVRNSEVKIVDTQTNKSVSYNELGEVWIRGPQVMKGYLDNPTATSFTVDKDGWLHTGDIGFIDRNEELFLTDRLKQVMKYKGYQVSPSELEAILISHPLISDVAVVGRQDEVVGDIPVAFVVKANGSDISETSIIEFVSNQVIYYKRVRAIYFIDNIPRSPTGKILWKDLKRILEEMP